MLHKHPPVDFTFILTLAFYTPSTLHNNNYDQSLSYKLHGHLFHRTNIYVLLHVQALLCQKYLVYFEVPLIFLSFYFFFTLCRLYHNFIFHTTLTLRHFSKLKMNRRRTQCSNIFSIKIPYPLVGSLTNTCVTAPTIRPFWTMGSQTLTCQVGSNTFLHFFFYS